MRNSKDSQLSKDIYLDKLVVQKFINYFIELIEGAPISHQFYIRDRKLPDQDPRRINPIFSIGSLKDAFDGYWWDKQDYAINSKKLSEVKLIVREAMKITSLPELNNAALNALRLVLKWGAGGTGQKLYKANDTWAKNHLSKLAKSLSLGCDAMSSNTPNVSIFHPNQNSTYARMNAGFTKYYSLACDDSIIYDGRVGAALGYLVKLFCKENKIIAIPPELAFRWGAQGGNNPLNRDPSEGPFVLPKLPTEGSIWAEWNIKANWILNYACKHNDANWCSGKDGLRCIESALFVIGYSMPKPHL